MKPFIWILCLTVCSVALPTWGQSDSVVRDGIEWLQPLDFTGYTYDQVQSICPRGACSGSLPGSEVDLTGYRWASADDLVFLFNSYALDHPFTAPFQQREAENDAFCDDFRGAHWSPGMGSGGPVSAGIIRDVRPQNGESLHEAYVSGVADCRYFYNPDEAGGILELISSDLSVYRGVWFWTPLAEPPEPPPGNGVNLNGIVKTAGDSEVCALVLASGQVTFSCDPLGVYALENLPTEPDGTVIRQIYARGFFPRVDVLQDSTLEKVILERATDCPDYNLPSSPDTFPQSSGNRHTVTGRVLLQSTDTPVCALVLANGSHTFSCDDSGNFALEFPLDDSGQYTLQAYADGFAPAVQTFNEFDNPQEVRMARASECKKTDAPNAVLADGKRWLQPSEFTGYSYDQVNAVCPDGVCTGSLPGSAFDLTGYRWASIEDAKSLFGTYQEMDRAVLEDFSYTTTDLSTRLLFAMLSDPPYEGVRVYMAVVGGVEPYTPDGELIEISHSPTNPSSKESYFGAWFWKPAN